MIVESGLIILDALGCVATSLAVLMLLHLPGLLLQYWRRRR